MNGYFLKLYDLARFHGRQDFQRTLPTKEIKRHNVGVEVAKLNALKAKVRCSCSIEKSAPPHKMSQ